MRTYTVIVYTEPEMVYSVTVPALPGCNTEGRNLLEALEMAKEAIELHLECLHEHGEPIPDDVSEATFELGEALEATAYRVTAREPADVPQVSPVA
jgi:antitoxin HicB